MSDPVEEAINQAHAELQAARGGAPADYFPLVYLEREFQVPREKAVAQCAIGPNELGVNAFHADAELKNLYLLRCDWTDKRNFFQLPLQQMVDSGMELIFGDGPPGIVPDQFLVQVKSAMLACQAAVERVFVHFVFRGDPAEAERSAVLAKLREDLENKKYLADKFFGRPITLVFQVRSAAGELGAPAHQKVTHSYPVRMDKVVEMNGPAGEIMRIGFARLSDLHAAYKEMGARFFESNIRAILSDDTPTNRSLNRAFSDIILEGKHDPLVFAFDHNGVTIHAEKVEASEGTLVLTEPRLLNGAQTIASYDRFVKANENDSRLRDRAQALGEISVICKIITDARAEFVQKVTLNNNRQNPIRPWNLHANDLIQLELQDKFASELGVYYERQEKAFLALTPEDLEEMEITENKAVELLRLAQTFLASDGELEKMSRMQEVFEDEAEYARVFGTQRLKADSRHIMLCYKMQFRLNRIIREIMERGEKKYFYMRRARNLVWALLMQAVLNEENLAELAEKFGKKLGMEVEYSELLAKLASTRVRFLISAGVDEHYASKVEEEKYGFLRTKTIFEDCLKDGRDKWGWARKKLG